ncbi:MAG: hypothetical protein C0410_11195 [Anaerolinea sp.]|nr:hypothetical protein [Anaerolinea sp.]
MLAFFSNIAYYYAVMRKANHIIVYISFIAYLNVSLLTHFAILGCFVNGGGNLFLVADEKKSRPIDSRPYVIPTKHIAISARVEVPSEASISTLQFPTTGSFRYDNVNSTMVLYSSGEYRRYRPRDPPVV